MTLRLCASIGCQRPRKDLTATAVREAPPTRYSGPSDRMENIVSRDKNKISATFNTGEKQTLIEKSAPKLDQAATRPHRLVNVYAGDDLVAIVLRDHMVITTANQTPSHRIDSEGFTPLHVVGDATHDLGATVSDLELFASGHRVIVRAAEVWAVTVRARRGRPSRIDAKIVSS